MAEKKSRRFFVWIVLGLLFVGLLGFGTGNIGGNVRTLGTVGSKEVRIADYQRAINSQTRAFEAQTGARLSFAEAQSLGLDQLALSQLVAQRSVDNEATELGISVGDERVREEVLRVPGFRGIDGNFDRDVYRSVLRQNGLTEAEFETGIREELSRTLLQGAVAGGLPTADTYADTIVEFIGAQRDFVWAEVTAADLEAALPEPTEADLTAFYDANPDLFTAPEARNITYAWLTPTMIQDELTIDETVLRETYDERITDYVTPERRLVERLAFLDDDAALAAKARLDNGEISFDALVAERGLELADIDLGDLSREELAAAGDAVFALSAGDVSDPVMTDVGPALFRVNGILAAQEISFEEAAPLLREELAASRARRLIEDSAEGITDLMAGGATLEALDERTDMTLGQIDWTADDQDGVAAYSEFRAAAASVEVGDFPELINLSDGGVLALRLNGITPPALLPQAEVTDELADAYTADATQKAVMARAEEIAAQTGPLTDLASFELIANVETGQTRQAFIQGTPPGFMTEVFELDLGETRVVENSNGAIVVRLDGVSPADRSDPQMAAQFETVSESAMAGIANDLYNIFSGDLQLRTDVNINQSTVNAVHASIGP